MLSGLLIIIFKRIFEYYRQLYFCGGDSILIAPFTVYSKPKSKWLQPLAIELHPGDKLTRDFRNKQQSLHPPKSVKIVSFNIEKGRQINKIIELFKQLDADIYCLNEVDINTQRTSYCDVLGEIASELKLNTIFCCEQIISDDKFTWKNNLKPSMPGYEGNAIMTKYDFIDTDGVIIDCVRKKHKHDHGRHTECSSIIRIPTDLEPIDIGVWSLHLDPHHCGMDGRCTQYLDILKHVKQQRIEKGIKHQILCGDLNTVINGIARLNLGVAPDWNSIVGTLGMTEAEYFDENAVKKGNEEYGLNLRDPFDKIRDFTFWSFKGWYQGKLDWCLLSKELKVVGKDVGSVKDRCSDHQWIMVDFTFP